MYVCGCVVVFALPSGMLALWVLWFKVCWLLLQPACVLSSMGASIGLSLRGQQQHVETNLLQCESSSPCEFQAANKLEPTMTLCEYSSLLGSILFEELGDIY